MATVHSFVFSPFQENTYVLADDNGECIIFDPGCYDDNERKVLADFIEEKNLKPIKLINTHCHLDHVFGNKFVAEKYNVPLEIHRGELPVLKSMPMVCMNYGLPMPEESPEPSHFLQEGDVVEFGSTKLEIVFTPGHSPASISFICREDKFVIAGDVLFYDSIGRTDLPGGNFETLMNSIHEKLMPLPDDFTVYCGHGPATTIGRERVSNPFVTGQIKM